MPPNTTPPTAPPPPPLPSPPPTRSPALAPHPRPADCAAATTASVSPPTRALPTAHVILCQSRGFIGHLLGLAGFGQCGDDIGVDQALRVRQMPLSLGKSRAGFATDGTPAGVDEVGSAGDPGLR